MGRRYTTYLRTDGSIGEPNRRQKLFHGIRPWNPVLIKGAIGGLGGGKSRACEEEQIVICLKTPQGNSFAGRLTMNRSDMSLIEDYQKLLAGVANWEASKKRFRFIDNDHLLSVAPADEWDRWGSVELTSFYLQEAQEMDWKIFDALTQRLRDPRGIVNGIPYYRGLFDARGVKKEHWIYKKFVEKAWDIDNPERHTEACSRGALCREHAKNPDFVYVRFRTSDNEQNIRGGYMDDLVRAHQDDFAWRQMMLEGEFGYDIEGRPVYEAYRPDTHDAEIIEDPTLPILRGVDFGYNRPAVVWCQYTRDGRLLVLRELCPQGLSRDELHAEVSGVQRAEFPDRHPSQYKDFGDVAGEQPNTTGVTDTEAWEAYFKTQIESRKARVNDGLEIVRKLMTSTTKRGLPRFQVDYRCETLREALGGAYYYSEDSYDQKTGDAKIERVQPYVDVADALRFIAHSAIDESVQVYSGFKSLTAFASY